MITGPCFPLRRARRLGALALLCACALLTAAGCSDRRLPRGPSPASATLTPPPLETETAGSVDPEDPADRFANAPHRLSAEFLNTGKSDCILMRLDGRVVMVDTADADDCHAICERLDREGIGTIDYLILTHYDNDHIGSAAEIIRRYAVGTVFMPDYVRVSYLYRALMEALEERGVAWRKLSEDEVVRLPFGEIWINPTRLYENGITLGADEANGPVEENNFSLISFVRFGDVGLLLTGDAEKARMAEFNRLIPERIRCGCCLVKTPHHGDSDKALLDALRLLRPRFCVICTDGPGRIAPRLEGCMEEIGTRAYRTYEGDIRFATDGHDAVLVQTP